MPLLLELANEHLFYFEHPDAATEMTPELVGGALAAAAQQLAAVRATAPADAVAAMQRHLDVTLAHVRARRAALAAAGDAAGAARYDELSAVATRL